MGMGEVNLVNPKNETELCKKK